MIKCRSRQATDPQKLKNCQQSFSRFLLVEAEAVEAIGVETEAVENNRFHIPACKCRSSCTEDHDKIKIFFCTEELLIESISQKSYSHKILFSYR